MAVGDCFFDALVVSLLLLTRWTIALFLSFLVRTANYTQSQCLEVLFFLISIGVIARGECFLESTIAPGVVIRHVPAAIMRLYPMCISSFNCFLFILIRFVVCPESKVVHRYLRHVFLPSTQG